jgi:hypothetical protein
MVSPAGSAKCEAGRQAAMTAAHGRWLRHASCPAADDPSPPVVRLRRRLESDGGIYACRRRREAGRQLRAERRSVVRLRRRLVGDDGIQPCACRNDMGTGATAEQGPRAGLCSLPTLPSPALAPWSPAPATPQTTPELACPAGSAPPSKSARPGLARTCLLARHAREAHRLQQVAVLAQLALPAVRLREAGGRGGQCPGGWEAALPACGTCRWLGHCWGAQRRRQQRQRRLQRQRRKTLAATHDSVPDAVCLLRPPPGVLT